MSNQKMPGSPSLLHLDQSFNGKDVVLFKGKQLLKLLDPSLSKTMFENGGQICNTLGLLCLRQCFKHYWWFETFANSSGWVPVSSLTVSRLNSEAKWHGESSSWIINSHPLMIYMACPHLVFIAELAALSRHFRAPSQDQVVRVPIRSNQGKLGSTDLPEQKYKATEIIWSALKWSPLDFHASVWHQKLATSINIATVLVPLFSESDLEQNGGAQDGLLNAIFSIIQRNDETISAQYILTFVISQQHDHLWLSSRNQ